VLGQHLEWKEVGAEETPREGGMVFWATLPYLLFLHHRWPRGPPRGGKRYVSIFFIN